MAETALDFLKKEATVDERGTAHVTQKKYVEFMEAHGVTKEVLEAHNDATNDLVNGMYQFNSQRLKDHIAKAKKAGEDPQKATVRTVINIPSGNIQMTSTGAKNYPVPGSDTRVTKVNVTSLQINQQRMINKDLIEDMEREIKKSLGL